MVILSLLLTACHQPKTASDYLLHPELLQPKLTQCQKMGRAALNDATCVTAYRAARKFDGLLQSAAKNQSQFGHQIALLQIQMVEAQQRLSQLQKNKVGTHAIQLQREKVSRLQFKVRQRLATVRFLTELAGQE